MSNRGPSRDRVHFKLPEHSCYEHSKNACTMINAAAKAFNISECEARKLAASRATIVVRPSQFARFLIYRNDMGGQNLFRELEPKLRPAIDTSIVDLSGNQHVALIED